MIPKQTDPDQNMKSRSDSGDGSDPRARTADDAVERQRERDLRAREMRDGLKASSWQDIKSRFVDDPAGAISAAEDMLRRAVDERVRALKAEIAEVCAPARDEDASSTEALRTRLIRYQAYCEKLAASSPH